MSTAKNRQRDPAATAALPLIAAAEVPTLAPPAADGAPPAPDGDAGQGAAPPGYELLGELGRGGMGVVYKARQLSLNRLVALKMILSGAHAGREELARFRSEAEAVARLQHPNIVQIHEVGEAEGRPYFSLEFVEGGSLAERLDGTPQPARPAARLVETLARAVHAAHQQGIIHRDLKPANILLRGEGRGARDEGRGASLGGPFLPSPLAPRPSPLIPKITDFGLAKRLDSAVGQTASGAILGTPSYIAPEQAGGRGKEVGPATDVYALGAILYELLTGRPPFKAETPLDTVLQVISEEPVPPSRLQPRLPRDLETICLKCLHKEPRKRYVSAAALADDLERFRADEPILARPTRPWERAWKWARRRPAVAALLAVTAVALGAVVGVGLAYQARLQRTNTELHEALADAEKQRDLAFRAGQATAREHQRAEAHLHKALAAVDRMLEQVGDERLALVPQFADLRRQLLEEALAFYRGFQEEGDEPAVRQQTARAHYRTGGLYLLLGQNDRAEAACQEALKLQDRLASDFPNQPRYRHDLGKTHSYLGHIHFIQGQFEAARKAYSQARTLDEQLLRDYPATSAYQESLANDFTYLGYYYLISDRSQAESYFRQAIRLAEQLVQAHPDTADYPCLLAGASASLGFILNSAGRLPEAEAALGRALALLQPANHPPPRAARDYPRVLALAQINQGALDLRLNRLARSETNLRKGLAAYEALLLQSPKHFQYRAQLAGSYWVLAQLYERTNRLALAEETWQKGARLTDQLARDHPTLSWVKLLAQQYHTAQVAAANRLRIFELLDLVQHGQIDKAVAGAQALAAKDLPGNATYNLACVLAYAAQAATADRSLAEDYGRRAVALLAKAEGRGFFRAPGAVEHAKKDADLNPLRQRDDFRQLMARVERQTQRTRPQPAGP